MLGSMHSQATYRQVVQTISEANLVDLWFLSASQKLSSELYSKPLGHSIGILVYGFLSGIEFRLCLI